MSLASATWASVNVIFAQLDLDVGPENVTETAHEMGIEAPLESLDGHTEYRRNVAVWREHLDGGNPSPPPALSIAELARQYMNWF